MRLGLVIAACMLTASLAASIGLTSRCSRATGAAIRRLLMQPAPHSAEEARGTATAGGARPPHAPADSRLADLPPPRQSHTPSVGLCLVARDERPEDLEEWLDHHRRLGVRKVYLFDHASKKPLHRSAAVRRLVREGFLSYRQFSHFLHPTLLEEARAQSAVYTYCLQDEFVILRGDANGMDLPTLLHDYSAAGGLCVNSRIFGSSGHKRRPAGGVLANYWRCMREGHPEQTMCKVFVQPQHVSEIVPHGAVFKAGHWAVDERRRPVRGAMSTDWSTSRIALHHYVLRSREDFAAKRARGSVESVRPKLWSYWDRIEERASSICTDGLDAAANQTAAAATRERVRQERR
eukprot:scaffold6.g2854.t1